MSDLFKTAIFVLLIVSLANKNYAYIGVIIRGLKFNFFCLYGKKQ